MPQSALTPYSSTPTAILNVKEGTDKYPSRENTNIKNPHDKFFKETFGDVSIAKDFLFHYLPQPLLQATDLNTLEPQKDSFINQDLEENFSDLLFKATIQGETGYFYFLFEHKSYPSKNIVLQLLKYMTEIWEAKANKEHNWELPLVIPLVIYHGKNNWNSAQSLGKMLLGYHLLPKALQIYIPDFEYVLYDLSDYSDEDIQGSAQLKAYLTICRDILTKDAKEFVHSIYQALDYLLEIEDEETRIAYLQLLFKYIFHAGKNLTQKEVNLVTENFPEGREFVMTLAEMYREEGEKKGLEKGIAKGVQQGVVDVTKRLISKGLPMQDIIEVTGLTEKEVKRLQKEMQQ